MEVNELIRRVMVQDHKTINDVVSATGYSYETIYNIILEKYYPTTIETYVILSSMDIDSDKIREYIK